MACRRLAKSVLQFYKVLPLKILSRDYEDKAVSLVHKNIHGQPHLEFLHVGIVLFQQRLHFLANVLPANTDENNILPILLSYEIKQKISNCISKVLLNI